MSYRLDPERNLINREARAAARRQTSIDAARASRPKDAGKRANLIAAMDEYQAAVGALEMATLMAKECGHRLQSIGSPRGEALKAAEKLFGGAG